MDGLTVSQIEGLTGVGRTTLRFIATATSLGLALDDALRPLDTIDRDGPCDRSCAFLRRDHSTPPESCSLPPPRWRRVLVHALARERSPEGVLRIGLAPAVLEVTADRPEGRAVVDVLFGE